MNTYTAPIGHILAVVFLLLIFIPDEEFHSSSSQSQGNKEAKTNNFSTFKLFYACLLRVKDTGLFEVF